MKPKDGVSPISNYVLEERYRDYLDECFGVVKIGGYEYDTSRALESVDPTAFRCGFADWISFELEANMTEIDGEYYDNHDLEDIEETENE